MDEDVDRGIINSVQCHVESIVDRLGLDADDYTIEVRRMGRVGDSPRLKLLPLIFKRPSADAVA